MDIKDSIKQSKIQAHEIHIDDALYENFSDSTDIDEHLAESNLLGWIELIENEALYEAVKSLSVEEQVLISYIVKECRTQRELSQIYNISQQNINKKNNSIIKKIKKAMKL